VVHLTLPKIKKIPALFLIYFIYLIIMTKFDLLLKEQGHYTLLLM